MFITPFSVPISSCQSLNQSVNCPSVSMFNGNPAITLRAKFYNQKQYSHNIPCHIRLHESGMAGKNEKDNRFVENLKSKLNIDSSALSSHKSFNLKYKTIKKTSRVDELIVKHEDSPTFIAEYEQSVYGFLWENLRNSIVIKCDSQTNL